MFLEIATRGGTSGYMRRADEDSVNGVKFFEVNQNHNVEDNQQERVKSKDGFELGYESVIKSIRRHLVDLFTKINFSQSKTTMYFLKKR